MWARSCWAFKSRQRSLPDECTSSRMLRVLTRASASREPVRHTGVLLYTASVRRVGYARHVCRNSEGGVVVDTGYVVGWGTLALINAGLAQGKNRSGRAWFSCHCSLARSPRSYCSSWRNCRPNPEQRCSPARRTHLTRWSAGSLAHGRRAGGSSTERQLCQGWWPLRRSNVHNVTPTPL
jgi:hypothetical protein